MRVRLNGEVVADGDKWLYDFFEVPAFSPQTVRDAIDQTPEGEELTLEINSGGGSVFAGFEMYSVLRAAQRRTVAEVQSLAGSAASVVMTGCDEVTASPVAQVMIHLPSTATYGDRYDHQDSIGVLDSVTDSILNAYVVKAGAKSTRAELRGLMKASTWLTAPEARGLGLVDRILGEEDVDPAAVLNACGGGRGIRAMAARPATDYGSLLDRYRTLMDEGKAPERPELRERSGKAEDAAEAHREAHREAIVLTCNVKDTEAAKEALEQVINRKPAVIVPEGVTIRETGPSDIFAEALAVLELEKTRFGGM